MAHAAARPSPVRTVVIVLLILLGLAELSSVAVMLAGSLSAARIVGYGAATAFLPITVAVILAAVSPPGRLVRGIVAVITIGFAGVRIGIAAVLLWLEPELQRWIRGDSPFIGAVLGIALAVWASAELARPVRSRVSVSVSSPELAPDITAEPHQKDPTINPPPAGSWSHGLTPWPRAEETDPDGTLIRPRRRT